MRFRIALFILSIAPTWYLFEIMYLITQGYSHNFRTAMDIRAK